VAALVYNGANSTGHTQIPVNRRRAMTIARWRSLVGTCAIGAVLLVVAPASAQSLTLTVDPVAYLYFGTYVKVTGTLSCDETIMEHEGTASATLLVSINQRAKGVNIGTVGMESFSCSAGTWSILLQSDTANLDGHNFKPGKAEVVAGAIICADAFGCIEEQVPARIQVLPLTAAP
jgi:hypothetical protein